ncbi:MAG: VCBS repeat-containing protein [Verrucomicrobia bacterium]|nr:VCBS repeat-containing protein [Verrucomicrobiota bacterium]
MPGDEDSMFKAALRHTIGRLGGLGLWMAVGLEPAAAQQTPPTCTTLPPSSVAETRGYLVGLLSSSALSTAYGFEWGLTTNYGNTTGFLPLWSPTNGVFLSALAFDLSPDTTYHYRLVATNGAGRSEGADVAFTTPRFPLVETLPPVQVGFTTATLRGAANPNGSAAGAFFVWGLGDRRNWATPEQKIGAGTNAVTMSQTLTGLLPGTLYSFRGVAFHVRNQTTRAAPLAFRTMGPTVQTLPASAITVTNATLRGLANPNGSAATAWFEWGATTNYGFLAPQQDLGDGTNEVSVSQEIAPLLADQSYHFRLVVTNADGRFEGADQSFTTPILVGTETPLPGVSSLPGVVPGSIAWGDYDGDGALDVFLGGDVESYWRNVPIAALFRNDGGAFRRNDSAFPQESQGPAWGDFDNDGDLDLLLLGRGVTAIYRNDRGVFTNIQALLPLVRTVSAAWGDDDNDGDLDLLLSGWTNAWWSDAFTVAFRNEHGVLTESGFRLPILSLRMAWVDYDQDGDFDMLLTDQAGTQRCFQNTNGTFLPVTPVPSEIVDPSAGWADFDNDGDLDRLTVANDGAPLLYRNQAGVLTNATSELDLSGCGWRPSCSVAWTDFDGDGDLDIMVAGVSTCFVDASVNALFRNYTSRSNSVPTVPTGLTATPCQASVTFRWQAASDGQTPASNLTYSLRVGTTPGGCDVVSPQADPVAGRRHVLQPGNAGYRLSHTITNLVLCRTYYWSVQAIDGAFAGSTFAPEHSVVVPGPPRISGLTRDTGSFVLQCNGTPGRGLAVQRTTDLLHWEEVAVLTADADGSSRFLETNVVGAPAIFYRLQEH